MLQQELQLLITNAEAQPLITSKVAAVLVIKGSLLALFFIPHPPPAHSATTFSPTHLLPESFKV